jgi:hypothetical protein
VNVARQLIQTYWLPFLPYFSQCSRKRLCLHRPGGVVGNSTEGTSNERTVHTATKFPFIYSFSGTCAASVPISTLNVSVSDFYIYSQDRSTYFLQQNRKTNQGYIHINRSQTHKFGNWDCGRAIPFLEIFVSNCSLQCILHM